MSMKGYGSGSGTGSIKLPKRPRPNRVGNIVTQGSKPKMKSR